MALSDEIPMRFEQAMHDIESQVRSRLGAAPGALRNAAADVLTGERSGRYYATAGGGYRASAPGEPPARRTGAYERSWNAQPLGEQNLPDGVRFTIRLATSMPERARRLEYGSGGVAARPHVERIRSAGVAEVLRLLRGGD